MIPHCDTSKHPDYEYDGDKDFGGGSGGSIGDGFDADDYDVDKKVHYWLVITKKLTQDITLLS